jgi:hypothetical protein
VFDIAVMDVPKLALTVGTLARRLLDENVLDVRMSISA